MNEYFKNYFQMIVALTSYACYDSEKTAESEAGKFVWMKHFLEENRIPYHWSNVEINGQNNLMLNFEKTSWSPTEFFEAEFSIDLFIKNVLHGTKGQKIEKKIINPKEVLDCLVKPIQEDYGVILNSWDDLEGFVQSHKSYQHLAKLREVSRFEKTDGLYPYNSFVLSEEGKHGYLFQYYTQKALDFDSLSPAEVMENGIDGVFSRGHEVDYKTVSDFKSLGFIHADYKVLESRDSYQPGMGNSNEENYFYDLAEKYNEVFSELMELDGSGEDPMVLSLNFFESSKLDVEQAIIHVDANSKETQEKVLKLLYMQSALASASFCYDISLFPNAETVMAMEVRLNGCPTVCNPLVTSEWADKAFYSDLNWNQYYAKFLQTVKPSILEKELKREVKPLVPDKSGPAKPTVLRF